MIDEKKKKNRKFSEFHARCGIKKYCPSCSFSKIPISIRALRQSVAESSELPKIKVFRPSRDVCRDVLRLHLSPGKNGISILKCVPPAATEYGGKLWAFQCGSEVR